MIPKIIHYCWISTEEKPELIKRCMKTWHKKLPDYEFILWDARRIAEEIKSTFVDEAIMVRKWAFAADYVRCFAVYKYGGIYLDTDVEVFKSFDDLLDNRMFIGQERATYHLNGHAYKITRLTSHCFGAEPEHPFLQFCLYYYKNRRFIRSMNWDLPDEMRYDQTLLPEIQAQLLTNYGYKIQAYYFNKKQTLSNGIKVFPQWYFDAPLTFSMRNVYCFHHCAGSWRNGYSPVKKGGSIKFLLWNAMKSINIIPRIWGYEIGINIIKW